MNIFGFNITRSKKPENKKDSTGGVILRQSEVLGPFNGIFKDWVPRKVMPQIYESLRESIPILDAAITTTTALDGLIRFEGKEGLVAEIEEWANSVRVNDPLIGEIGLQAFVDNLTNETYEQGVSLSEFVLDDATKNIIQLNVADSKDIRFRQTPNGREVWYKGISNSGKSKDDLERVANILRNNTSGSILSQLTRAGYKKLNPLALIYYSINNENTNPYGTSYLRSCEFVSRILLTIENANLSAWERFGDPIFHIAYKHSKKKLSQTELTERKEAITKAFKEVIEQKQLGKSADFVTAVDADSSVEISIIGADNQILEIKEPMAHAVGQILSHFPIAPWMLGQNLGTTERLADREVDMVLADATTRAKKKRLPIQSLIETQLRLRGRKWKKGDIVVSFEQPNLHDVVKKAQANFLNAQAAYYGFPNPDEEKKSAGTYEVKYLPSSKAFSGTLREKLANHRKSYESKNFHSCAEKRKMPSPVLDRLMKEFADGLTDRWNKVPEGIFRRLGIEDAESGKAPSDEEQMPSPEHITAAVSAEVSLFVDDVSLSTTSEQGIIARFIDRSYSAGLLDAAIAVLQESPIGDIITNQTAVAELENSAFDLVIDKVLKAQKSELLPELKRMALLGGNPKDIPRKFRNFFASRNYNYQWRRLARSELAIAYEVGKADEWKAQGAKSLFYEPAPDACPICLALKGEYPIDQCPIPVIDTHPNCACTRRLI